MLSLLLYPDVFKADPEFLENEEKYKAIRKEILDEDSEDSGSGGESGSSEEDSDEQEAAGEVLTQTPFIHN